MDLHETDYITYYNVHSIRFTSDLFHKVYFIKFSIKNQNLPDLRNQELSNFLRSDECKQYNYCYFMGAFNSRINAFHRLSAKIECDGWFRPENRAMVNNRHPYIAAAAVQPMEFEVIDGYPDFTFNPNNFRERLREIEKLWDIPPDIDLRSE